ncbi:MAG: four helix bundle protein [Bacteroidia bacterium]
MAFKFEDLRVWQGALELGSKIRVLTRSFPTEEKYGLSSQIIRATDSIGLNIAEGSSGLSNAEFKRFLNISIRSGIEVIACLHIAKKNDYISSETFSELYKQTEDLIVQIQALRNAIN